MDHFSSYQYGSSEACGSISNCTALEPSSNSTCGQGRVANYAVHAETAEDIQEYVKFATKHNLRIVIKNTGHDLLGRSSANGESLERLSSPASLFVKIMLSSFNSAHLVTDNCCHLFLSLLFAHSFRSLPVRSFSRWICSLDSQAQRDQVPQEVRSSWSTLR